ncbi:zinc finger BED domain-containing protein RICESLEEPER 2-like [Senna tora]|uniref:Zinc finger BED domain-containing protein RICESLEEPER 2-like n=1 Tax=Senna tora TaxID=362788 RepID=A0A834WBG5_9FABA|nr:zinc finger BED domain-containing protein RICESLEEPER 2-like [Senna tora]
MNSDNVDSSIGNMIKENVAKVSASSQKEDETLSEKPPLSKKPKTCTSEVWKYFTRIGIVDGKEKAQCKGLPKYKNIGVMMLDQAERLRPRQVDPKRVREVMSMAIIEHDLPYSFVEYRRVRELLNLLNPDVKHISRNTAMSDVWKFYLDQKDKLKKRMAKSRGRICLTSDCWTSYTTEGYICLTAHFIDESWKLNSKILSFCKMEPPHSGVELARKIFNCLKEWGIDRKIFSLTLDNASANDSMQSILKEHLSLQNSLLCRGEFFHVRCCAHILNLIVQEGLKVASGALNKIRESIKYVKASEARMISFNECVAQVGGIDTGMGLRLDVSTRWNSTYVMLESAIKYRRAFGSLSLFDKNFKNCPSNEEWMRAEKMKDFLLSFNVITNLFSGSSYPTSNTYFMQIWKIKCLLIENLGVDDLVIQDMATRMKEKFDKYWSDYSVILAIATVLDPRMKFDALKFCYSKLHPINWEQKLENIKTKLYTLFAQYETRDDGASSSSVAVPPTTSFYYTTFFN